MAADDWALVVGIQHYPAPGLGKLQGPEHDARDFFDWVTSTNGGSVPIGAASPTDPAAQARLILSSHFEPLANAPINAQPTYAAIENWFDRLYSIADQNLKAGKGYRVGRRLYIYLSGHGLTALGDEAALMMANWSKEIPYHNVAGRPFAQHFLRAGFFDEAFLIMDTCRDLFPKASPGLPRYPPIVGGAGLNGARVFYGLATKWSLQARERQMPPANEVKGIFTHALLEGLRGAASESSGNVTASSLGRYLYSRMGQLTGNGNGGTGNFQAPDIEYDTDPAKRFVIVTTAPQKANVLIAIPPAGVGHPARILGASFQEVTSIASATAVWSVNLPPGLYLVETLGPVPNRVPFEVSGAGGTVNVKA